MHSREHSSNQAVRKDSSFCVCIFLWIPIWAPKKFFRGEWRHGYAAWPSRSFQNGGSRCRTFHFFFIEIASTSEAKTTVSYLTQCELFITDGKNTRFLEWPSPLNKTTYPLQSTISCLDTRKAAILHNTRRKSHGQTRIWRHSPLKKFFGRPYWRPQKDTYTKLEFFRTAWLELCSLECN